MNGRVSVMKLVNVKSSEEFSWDEVYGRRAELARKIVRHMDRTDLCLAGEIREPFAWHREMDPESLDEYFLADHAFYRVPFLIVARRMEELANSRVIDHAWWLISSDLGREPWGFVTEPYMGQREAGELVARLNEELAAGVGSGLVVRAWPKQQSAWYPGRTVAIVTTVVGGDCLSRMLRYAASELLRRLGS